MSNETALWNKVNSAWRNIEDSPSITLDRSDRDTVKFNAVPAADTAEARIKGRAVGAGAGAVQDLTGAQAVAILPDASGRRNRRRGLGGRYLPHAHPHR